MGIKLQSYVSNMDKEKIQIAVDTSPDFRRFIQNRIDAVISHLQSENTRECARKIIALLKDAREKDPEGWVQSSYIFNSLNNYNPSTITRLLKSLSDEEKGMGLIERWVPPQEKPRPGKPAVFYRMPHSYDMDRINRLLSREELIEGNAALNKMLKKFVMKYKIAKGLLRDHGVEDPDAAIEERFIELYKTLITELQKSDAEIQKESAERMKDADLGPGGEMLVPWEDLDSNNKEK